MENILESIRRIIKKKVSLRGLAKDIGVDRSSLYCSLKDGGNPRLKTLTKVLNYLGYELKISKTKGRREVNPKKSKPSRSRRRKDDT